MTVTGLYGDVFELEQKAFSSGGEGDIYAISGNSAQVVKLYHKDKITNELEEKIKYMTGKQPDRNVIDQVAWPLDAVYDGSGSFCGFVMPRLNIDVSLSEVYVYPPKLQLSFQQKLIIAQNICAVISAVHEAGYIFGDFNPLNIGVNVSNGNVAFLDTDSYHIVLNDQKAYRCKVCLDGYVAPELLKKCEAFKKDAYANAPLPTFTKETDNFALAIHIFKLLMNGFTPFNGIKETESASTGSPGQGNQAIKRDSYCFKPGNKPQAVAVPPLDVLPEEISDLFTRAFMYGKIDPSQRPSAREWHKALNDYSNDLVTCNINPLHMYRKDLCGCPWCEADARYTNAMTPSLKQISFTNVPTPIAVPSATSSTSSTASVDFVALFGTFFSIIKSGISTVVQWIIGWPQKTKRLVATLAIVVSAFAVTISVVNNIIVPNLKYVSAKTLLGKEQYDEAYAAFSDLGDYKDSSEMAQKAVQLESDAKHYDKALEFLSDNQLIEARSEFEQTNEYKDSLVQIDAITETINAEKYSDAEKLYSAGDYEAAIKAYSEIADYLDSKAKIENATEAINKEKYEEAELQLSNGNYAEAISAFTEIKTYSDSQNRIEQINDIMLKNQYDEAEALFAEEKFDEAIEAFSQIKDYSDSKSRIDQIKDAKINKKYEEAESCRENGEYDKAVEIYEELDAYKDSKDKRLQSMYDYAVANKNASDVQTQKYLIELKLIGYKDSQAIFDSLFYYTMDIIVNYSEDDISTDLSEVDEANDIYIHYNIRYTGDESLFDADKRVHTVYYERWRLGREAVNTYTNIESGWHVCCINRTYGTSAGEHKVTFRIDNYPQVHERTIRMYWLHDGVKHY